MSSQVFSAASLTDLKAILPVAGSRANAHIAGAFGVYRFDTSITSGESIPQLIASTNSSAPAGRWVLQYPLRSPLLFNKTSATVEDCGRRFYLKLDDTTAFPPDPVTGVQSFTLPATADIENGWWCEFYVEAMPSAYQKAAVSVAAGDVGKTIKYMQAASDFYLTGMEEAFRVTYSNNVFYVDFLSPGNYNKITARFYDHRTPNEIAGTGAWEHYFNDQNYPDLQSFSQFEIDASYPNLSVCRVPVDGVYRLAAKSVGRVSGGTSTGELYAALGNVAAGAPGGFVSAAMPISPDLSKVRLPVSYDIRLGAGDLVVGQYYASTSVTFDRKNSYFEMRLISR